LATESQVNGTKFNTSENFSILPQIVTVVQDVVVNPLWGDEELCQVSITRADTDLTQTKNIEIKPTAIFMGSIFSDTDKGSLKKKCKPPLRAGAMCSLTSGPGQILAIRHTIRQDVYGRPLLEEYELENNGNVIDENGTWLLDVPMNLDYIITNEFGEQVFSNDERKGVPTKAKYRFKVKWNQSPDLSAPVRRANFLVPNVAEHGWTSSGSDPYALNFNDEKYQRMKASYAFTLNWDNYGLTGDTYGEQMIQDAIDCKDRFYEMTYNKVYTVSQLITRYSKGILNRRFSGIKNITDDECEGSFNKFPTNDAQFKPDLLFIAFSILIIFFSLILKIVVRIFHVLCSIAKWLINFRIKVGKNGNLYDKRPFENVPALRAILERFSTINIPLYAFPDCELCNCKTEQTNQLANLFASQAQSEFANSSVLADVINPDSYSVTAGDANNDWTEAVASSFSGFRPTNSNLFFCYGTSAPVFSEYVYYGSDGSEFNVLLAYGSWGPPVPEMINLFNLKGKFFGTGLGLTENLSDINLESTLNLTQSNSIYYLNGGGVTQVKISFNITQNTPNYNPDFVYNSNNDLIQNSNSPLVNWSETNRYHYDNVMVLLTEEVYEVGTLLSLTNPLSYQDPNLSGATLNQFGTSSIVGENRYGTGANPNAYYTNISHTNPMTGERLITRYRLSGSPQDENQFLRFPTNMEYFQVVTSMTYSNFVAIQGGDPGMNVISLYNRVLRNDFTEKQVYKIQWNNGEYNKNSFYYPPFGVYSDKGSANVTILMRGVDPHSSKQKTRVGLGRFFSYQNHWAVSVTADLRMNIPLQPNDGFDFGEQPDNNSQARARDNAHRCTRHNFIGVNNSGYENSYSFNRLFYKSYRFKPSTSQWTSYTNYSVNDYITTSESDINANLLDGFTLSPTLISSSIPNIQLSNYTFTPQTNGRGIRIGADNRACYSQFSNSVPPPNRVNDFNMKYQLGEIVEGGSVVCVGGGPIPAPFQISTITIGSITASQYYYWSLPKYFSKKYTTANIQMTDSERIVMRSDRLPTSDQWQQIGSNAMAGMQNSKFQLYVVPDEGVVSTGGTIPQQTLVINESEPVEDVPNKISEILESFSCGSLVPVNCYVNDPPDSISVAPTGTCTFKTFADSYGTFNTQFFIQGSCYSLVREPFNQKDNVNFDMELINEWASRMNINFGACREVFSHLFINNWVNGSLFMYPFKNSRYFTGPLDNPPNQPYNKFCTDTVYLHPETFNFYYRSSPYNGTNFVGKDGFEFNNKYYGNRKNLLYPTTIMDLGPRDELQKFLSQSGNWDGYIVNRLESSTFGDTSDLLNIFIISRLANTSFSSLFRSRGSSVLNFFSRTQKFVDADFAQTIATNSQLGIASYDPESYPEPPPDDTTSNSSLYLPVGFSDPGQIVFGIFFTGDSQLRDYISPNRTIWNPGGQVTNQCSYSYIPLNSKTVPFYLCEIKNNGNIDNIFGTQQNEWAIDSSYSYEYQGLDRFVPYSQSKIYQTDSNIINYRKGWIYNVEPNFINVATNELDYKPTPGKIGQYNLGAPFYFYFGLNRGASAFDRFTTKWIDTDAFAQ
jgi:hypothetical protein